MPWVGRGRAVSAALSCALARARAALQVDVVTGVTLAGPDPTGARASLCTMSRPISPAELRDAIANTLWAHTKAYETEQACDALGLPPAPANTDPWASKTVYVRSRLAGRSREELLEITRKIIDDYGADELEQYLAGVGIKGVDGEMKNLIFAADGPKPRIVLRDAVNNVIEIVDNEQFCLIYDRPLGPEGMTWARLVEWWRDQHDPEAANNLAAGRSLYERLRRSLQSPGEELVFRTYCARYAADGGFELPALVPQIYLHYDPYTKRELAPKEGPLVRQRMDFLMLFGDRSRAVIEIDGRQHYASGVDLQNPDPERYASMVSEDRALQLGGYEVYRFGTVELHGQAGETRVNAFFDALLERHSP
jgi:very-short-patch-repair endonuclease